MTEFEEKIVSSLAKLETDVEHIKNKLEDISNCKVDKVQFEEHKKTFWGASSAFFAIIAGIVGTLYSIIIGG